MLDQKPLEFRLPDIAAQTVLFEVGDLDVGYHSIVFNTSRATREVTAREARISRVEIDTGLTGCVLMLDCLGTRQILSSCFRRMVPRVSYGADSKVWSKSGECEIRTVDAAGSLRSIQSQTRWDYLGLSGGLDGRTPHLCQYSLQITHSLSLSWCCFLVWKCRRGSWRNSRQCLQPDDDRRRGPISVSHGPGECRRDRLPTVLCRHPIRGLERHHDWKYGHW